MKRIEVDRQNLVLSPELSRSRAPKVFEERLRASIEEVGLAEPIKVAAMPDGKFLVVDGMLRISAIDAIRASEPETFKAIPAYVVPYDKRFEVRYQTDIYQDLLPSQLAGLVEHLVQAENIRKIDIGKYIGVAPTTIRNYTGLWRMLERGELFAGVVDLMDVGVIPSSNPYAWLRLSDWGIRHVVEAQFSDGERAEEWIAQRVADARRGRVRPYQLRFVEQATGNLEPVCYREDEQIRNQKRDLGLRRAIPRKSKEIQDTADAVRHLNAVIIVSTDEILKTAAQSLSEYLQ